MSDKLQKKMGKLRKVAYQEDMAVLNSYRGQGIAQELLYKRLEDFLRQGLEVGVVSTLQRPEPSVTYTWFTGKLSYEVVSECADGRVILARKLEDLL